MSYYGQQPPVGVPPQQGEAPALPVFDLSALFIIQITFVFLRLLPVPNYLWRVDLDFSRLPGEGRLPASGVPTGRLPPAGAGLPAAGLPAAGLPAAVRAAASTAAAEQRAFLHGGMVRSYSSSPSPPLLCCAAVMAWLIIRC